MYAMIDLQDDKAVCVACERDWKLPPDRDDMEAVQAIWLDIVRHLVAEHREPFYAAAALLMWASAYVDSDEPDFDRITKAMQRAASAIAGLGGAGDDAFGRSFERDMERKRRGRAV